MVRQRESNIDSRIYDQFNSRCPFKLEDATMLVLTLAGSHSHNTYIPKTDPNAVDDIDFIGIIVPPIEYTLGMNNWDSVNFIFEELDCVFYSFRKFIGLLTKGNPNVLGLLFLDNSSIIHQHPMWSTVVFERAAFENKKLTFGSFVRYARNQFKRMTRFDLSTQNQWDGAVELITAAGWTVQDITREKSRPMPQYDTVREILRKKLQLLDVGNTFCDIHLDIASKLITTIHARHFHGYMGEKRKNLVRQFGYDTKNAAHLIRLMRMCCEYLHTGILRVWRTVDAQEIKDIKSGKWEFERVQQVSEELFDKAESLYAGSKLPEEPDLDWINELCVHVLMDVYGLTCDPSSPAYSLAWSRP